jgi:hypothetical protein
MRNQAKGYNEEKENIRLPRINSGVSNINDNKSYLQGRGAQIMMAAGYKQSH